MALNQSYIPGNVVTFSNSTGSAIASGDTVIVGSIGGVALVDIPDGSSGSVAIADMSFHLDATGTAITQGEKVNITANGSAVTTGAGTAIGIALADEANDKVHVRLGIGV